MSRNVKPIVKLTPDTFPRYRESGDLPCLKFLFLITSDLSVLKIELREPLSLSRPLTRKKGVVTRCPFSPRGPNLIVVPLYRAIVYNPRHL